MRGEGLGSWKPGSWNPFKGRVARRGLFQSLTRLFAHICLCTNCQEGALRALLSLFKDCGRQEEERRRRIWIWPQRRHDCPSKEKVFKRYQGTRICRPTPPLKGNLLESLLASMENSETRKFVSATEFFALWPLFLSDTESPHGSRLAG